MVHHWACRAVLVAAMALFPPHERPWADEISLSVANGVYHIPVRINGVFTLQAILDTGAGDVQIPADVMLTLMRTGTIRGSDFLPGGRYILADGSTAKSDRFVLRELQIGNRRIENVTASVGNVKGDLLLGHSFLSRLPAWSIDNRRQVLVLGDETSLPSSPPVPAPSPSLSEATPAPVETSSGPRWVAFWDSDVWAIATQYTCTVGEFEAAGYRYMFVQAIPMARLGNPTDSWFTKDGRAITVVGCWSPAEDGHVYARMRRKKDGKTWDWAGRFDDGVWRKIN